MRKTIVSGLEDRNKVSKELSVILDKSESRGMDLQKQRENRFMFAIDLQAVEE